MNSLNQKIMAAVVASLFAASIGCTADQQTREPQDTGMQNSETSDTREPMSDVMGEREKNMKTHSASIEFPKGEARLSEDARKKLQKTISEAKSQGELDKVKVAVWSDSSLPTGEQELSDQAKELASNRIDQLESYMEQELGVSDVEVYNMSERTNWLARLFNSDEAELKSAFGREDAEFSNKDFQTIKDEGGPSKAVVITKMKPRQQ